MKNILILLLCLVSHLSIADRGPEMTAVSQLQAMKSDSEEYYFEVYMDTRDLGPSSLMNYDLPRLKKTLNIYDNAELKGEPVYIVNSTEIKTDKEVYKFSNAFIGKCSFGCEKYNFMPIDFIRIYSDQVALAIKDYKNNIARVEHRSKIYYFKIETSDVKRFGTRIYRNAENIKRILEKDPSYQSFIDELRICIKKKDLKCLQPILSPDNLTVEKIEKEARKRGVYDDKKLCQKQAERIESSDDIMVYYDIPDDLLKEVKSVDFIWNKLEQCLDLSGKNISRFLLLDDLDTKTNFTFSKDLPTPSSCQDQELDFVLEVQKKDQKWKIVTLGFIGFSD